MEDLLKRPFNLKRTEFWAATVIYVFAVFFLFSGNGRNRDYLFWRFQDTHVAYTYFSNYFFPKLIRYTVLYSGFILLTLKIVPPLIKKENIVLNILYIFFLTITIGITFSITDTWLRAWLIKEHNNNLQDFYDRIFKENIIYAFWLMMMYSFYVAVTFSAEYILSNTEKVAEQYRAVTRECAYALVVWMIVMLMLMGNNVPELAMFWVIVGPFSIGLYWYSFYDLIPQSLLTTKRFRTYLSKVNLIVLFGSIPLSFIVLVIYSHEEILLIPLFNVGFQLLITAPLTWHVYKRRQVADSQLYQLKTELGRSNADLNFLRSQINPHFLFNSLNTLYGTALQENSEQTANGIQKLGDMMRFMLHENHQDRILLAREIDYMRNYIDLQLLRTQSSPDIRVETNIEDPKNDKQLAPMLLIPFVENAFKHGISLAKPSYIKMTLFSNDKELYFDVYNSIHPKTGEDPESNYSGIGLENVKQRLNLLYPGQHKLIIRETAKEYFVHLTIQF